MENFGNNNIGEVMNKIIIRLKKEFTLNPDLVIKEIKINIFKKIYVIFLETLSSSKNNLANFLAGPNQKQINNIDEIEFYLTNGFTIIIYDDLIYAIETKAELTRSIATNEVQTSINGPKNAFTEKDHHF